MKLTNVEKHVPEAARMRARRHGEGRRGGGGGARVGQGRVNESVERSTMAADAATDAAAQSGAPGARELRASLVVR